MSFEPQENYGSCGTAALRYALSLLGCGHVGGRKMTEITLRKVIGKTRFSQQRKGTSEDEIAAAAHRLGLEVAVHSYAKSNPRQFLTDLQIATGTGHSCIVSFHDDHKNHFHWVCVAGFDGPDVIVFDPALLDSDLPEVLFDPVDPNGEYVPAAMSIRRFIEWTTPGEPLKEGEESHYFIELWPSDDHIERFVPGKWTGDLLRAMEEDPDLCCYFDEYIDDLRSIFGVPGRNGEGRPAHKFLLEHEGWLLRLADQWTRDPEQVMFFVQEIKTLLAITKAYPFTVAAGDEAHALARLTYYLGWAGCESAYEVGRFD